MVYLLNEKMAKFKLWFHMKENKDRVKSPFYIQKGF